MGGIIMTPEKLTEELKQACPKGLKSIILYGSAAAGDRIEKKSDYNVLVVTDNLDIRTLNSIAKTASAWSKAGNPAPLLFTEDRLARATDVFPIELLDICECHVELMTRSLSTFLVLFRASLRLFEEQVPQKKFEALEKLSTHLAFDGAVFLTVEGLRDGSRKPKDISAEELFSNYLRTIECVVDAVDAYIHKGE
jgi:predicted nucleotidyltransferase